MRTSMILLVSLLVIPDLLWGQQRLPGEFAIEFSKELIPYESTPGPCLSATFPTITQLTTLLADDRIRPVLFFPLYVDQNNNYTPQWSHDARRLAFLQADIDRRTCKIKIMEDLSHQQVYTIFGHRPDSYDYMFAWSPVGKYCYVLASQQAQDGYMNIYLAQERQPPQQVTQGPGLKKHPCIAPQPPLRLIYEHQGKLRQLLFNGQGKLSRVQKFANGTQPAFNPRGASLAYIKEIGRQHERPIYNLTLHYLLTGREQTIFPPGAQLRNPTWSPDGRHLAFYVQNDQHNFAWNLYVKRIDSDRAARCLANDVLIQNHFDFFGPAWSPDSRKLFFFSNQDAQDGYYRIHWVDLRGHQGMIEYSDEITTATDLATSPCDCDLAFAAIADIAQGIYILILNHY